MFLCDDPDPRSDNCLSNTPRGTVDGRTVFDFICFLFSTVLISLLLHSYSSFRLFWFDLATRLHSTLFSVCGRKSGSSRGYLSGMVDLGEVALPSRRRFFLRNTHRPMVARSCTYVLLSNDKDNTVTEMRAVQQISLIVTLLVYIISHRPRICGK